MKLMHFAFSLNRTRNLRFLRIFPDSSSRDCKNCERLVTHVRRAVCKDRKTATSDFRQTVERRHLCTRENVFYFIASRKQRNVRSGDPEARGPGGKSRDNRNFIMRSYVNPSRTSQRCDPFQETRVIKQSNY